MSQENTQGDTQEAPQQEYASLEEAVFSGDVGSSDIADVFTTKTENGETEQAPTQGQPQVSGQETTQNNSEPSNDEKRFQYWQSRADKVANENATLKQQLQQQQTVPAQQMQPQAQAAPQKEEFPPPPPRPDRPSNFNREEAYSDPNSESARHLDEVEGWRDNMSEYNSLKNQYQNAILAEKLNSYDKERVENVKRAQAQQQAMQQKNEVANYVMGHHGMTKEETTDFINRMSDPNSISLDNLVSLYRLNQGGGNQQNNPSQPSQEFQQVQNAQQVPSPMGVMPSGTSNTDSRTSEDKIMDSMIGNFNSKNPWK
jgi:hypothetical protein